MVPILSRHNPGDLQLSVGGHFPVCLGINWAFPGCPLKVAWLCLVRLKIERPSENSKTLVVLFLVIFHPTIMLSAKLFIGSRISGNIFAKGKVKLV
jgi:hypothetical protein